MLTSEVKNNTEMWKYRPKPYFAYYAIMAQTDTVIEPQRVTNL